jgi:hypothetical protein
MSEKLESSIVDSVSNANFKNIAEAGAFYSGLSMRDAVESQRRMSVVADQAVGALLKQYNEIDTVEALSIVKANTGFDKASQMHDIAGVLASLGATLGAIQMQIKTAQTTNPQTGK